MIETDSQRIEVTVSGTNEDMRFPFKDGWATEVTMDYGEFCETYLHLKMLPLTNYFGLSLRLIIGVDNAKFIGSLKSREGSTGELVASKTRRGWFVYGTNTARITFMENVNVHVELTENGASMHDLFGQFLAIEVATINRTQQFKDDKQALKILE